MAISNSDRMNNLITRIKSNLAEVSIQADDNLYAAIEDIIEDTHKLQSIFHHSIVLNK